MLADSVAYNDGVSVISGMKEAVQAIKEKTHGRVDYLFETQGGPPMGNYNLTSDGIEQHFATQVLSRFALNEALASEGILRTASVNIAAPGAKASTFDLNDVESKSSKDSNAISLMLAKAKNEGVVTDAATLVRTSLPSYTIWRSKGSRLYRPAGLARQIPKYSLLSRFPRCCDY